MIMKKPFQFISVVVLRMVLYHEKVELEQTSSVIMTVMDEINKG